MTQLKFLRIQGGLLPNLKKICFQIVLFLLVSNYCWLTWSWAVKGGKRVKLLSSFRLELRRIAIKNRTVIPFGAETNWRVRERRFDNRDLFCSRKAMNSCKRKKKQINLADAKRKWAKSTFQRTTNKLEQFAFGRKDK